MSKNYNSNKLEISMDIESTKRRKLSRKKNKTMDDLLEQSSIPKMDSRMFNAKVKEIKLKNKKINSMRKKDKTFFKNHPLRQLLDKESDNDQAPQIDDLIAKITETYNKKNTFQKVKNISKGELLDFLKGNFFSLFLLILSDDILCYAMIVDQMLLM